MSKSATTNYAFKKEQLGHPPRDTALGANLDAIDTTLKTLSDTIGDFGPLASAKIVVGDSEGAAAAVAMSGDVTVDNLGETTIGADKVTKVEIAADIAGNGLVQAVGGELNMNVDDSTVEVDTDILRIKDLGVSLAKLAATLLKGIVTLEMSFETGLVTATKMYFPFKVTINKIRSIVMGAIEASDNGTITGANTGGDSDTGVVTVEGGAAVNVEDDASPTSNNVIAADSWYQLTTAKATKGGTVLVTLEYTRTA